MSERLAELIEKEMSGDLYQKWRESEAYAVSMTEDGVKRSEQRWRGFNKGYKQAMKDAVDLIKAELVHASDTSSERVNKTEKSEHEDWYGQWQWRCGYERGWDKAMEREWVGLTDEEIADIFELNSAILSGGEYDMDEVMYDKGFENAVATIEAKLKEKNT